MRKKRRSIFYLLFFIFLLFIGGISFIGYRTYQKMILMEKEITSLTEELKIMQEKLLQAEEKAVQEHTTQIIEDSSHPEPPPSGEPGTQAEGMISPPGNFNSVFSDNSDETMNALFAELQYKLPQNNGDWSVYVCDLKNNSEGSINEHSMQAASLIKLFIMGAVYEKYETLSAQYGSETLDSYLRPMITVSDNDAANILVEYLGNGDTNAGMAAVNAFCQSHGYTNTSMGRLLLHSNEFGDNYTSVSDCGKFLREIYQINAGTAENPTLSHAEAMYSLLQQQERRNKIPGAMPQGVSIANKTGELSNVENDAGIIYNTAQGNDLIVCFMSENLNAPGDAQHSISQNSYYIYSYYNE